MAEPQKGRIAIKLGGPAQPASSKSKLPPPSTLGKRQRSNAWGGGDDSDNDDEGASGKHEAITGFGAEGAENERAKAKEAKKEFVIARQGNRDWKAQARAHRGGRDLLPPEARAKRAGADIAETEPADQDKGIKWGLTIMEKKKADDGETDEAPADPTPAKDTQAKHDEEPAPTADDEALDALLGRKPKAQKTIPSETDAFQRDMNVAGDASTLADYEAMPVEEFGAALLRGMGWNGEERGAKRKEVKRRPNKLGLGAKALNEAEDLGGWDQNGARKKKRPPTLSEYNRKEEERKKQSRRYDDDDRRERDRDRDGGHRHRARDSDRDRYRHQDSHSDRHRHRESRHDRR